MLKHAGGAMLTVVLAYAVAIPGAEAKSISISWVGDMALSRHYGLPPGGPARALHGVRKQLRPNDLAIGNLEGTLGRGGSPKCGAGGKNCFAFQAPASYAGGYRRSGFDAVNVANNHALDFGPGGQAQTLAALRRHHIAWTGRPGQITLRRVKGVRVALLGFAPYPWASPLLNIAAAAGLVRKASRRADVVVALIHAGAEGANRTHTPRGPELAFGENRGNPRAFAHAAVRAGADLVLGSGPHVVRGVERYRRRLIAYSLGNFLGYHTFSTGGVLSQSGILRVRVSEKGVPLRGRWVSVRLDGAGVPRLGGHSARLVRSLSRQDFGRRAYPMDSRGRL